MSSSAYPDQVLIVRHGEKLGESSDDTDGGPDLSVRGAARAAALPSLFAPAPNQQYQLSCAVAAGAGGFTGTYNQVSIAGSPPRFATPDFIFATKASSHSNRPVETITPLAAALNISYDDQHVDSDDAKVASDILTHAKYAGKVVLICWHHGHIPKLAQALGLQTPPSWPGTVFDWVWQITWPNGQVLLTSHCQMLLYGDTTC